MIRINKRHSNVNHFHAFDYYLKMNVFYLTNFKIFSLNFYKIYYNIYNKLFFYFFT